LTGVDQVHAILALTWLDHDLLPRCVVADDMSLLWANLAGRAALARRRDLEVRAEIVSATNQAYQQALHSFVLGSGAGVATYCLPRVDGDGHLLIRAQRLDWTDTPAFGILFSGTGSDHVQRYANLDVAFGLTHAEHRVLLELLDGQDVDRLARKHQVSVETTRSHIRKIYQKLGVNTREAMFRKARAFGI